MDFVPHHAPITAPGATPARWMPVLHGILGSGANWRTFAKRLAAARPSWGFALVDLRMHGLSQGAPPPHTLAAAAEDLVRLGAALPGPVRGVLGHSFGGKVALELARREPGLELAVIVDANPGARERVGASAVVAALASLPERLPSRERFVELVTERGLDRATAEWLAMNVRPSGDAFRFRLDLRAIDELLTDYCARDYWPMLEAAKERPELCFVVGGRSDGFSPADRARLAELSVRRPGVSMHVLPGAAHNVHVDDPDGLVEVIVGALDRAT